MRFKELRQLIFTPCKVIIGRDESLFLNTHEETDYDEREVIGIRVRDCIIIGYTSSSYIEVLCK